ncbi:MAG: ABC transporter permease, partial [Methanoregulaceae archaeon]|nr:ABC transporter permease [Methanoregulaceae archaeon]
MSYLVYIALFGAAVVFFLWLRDARIFYRTGLSG